ncbi:MAG TPA: hypothetical protein VD930_13545 [Gemmatimonadales bacterium]|nr:hypothetical protein [Gemmatimonadales bacterium]
MPSIGEFEPYPLPLIGTPEEAVKGGLKAHRSLSRLRITVGGGPHGRYVELNRFFCWLLDVWVRADRLPIIQRLIIKRTMLDETPCSGSDTKAPVTRFRRNQSITDESLCPVCKENWPVNRAGRFVEHDRHYTNAEVARELGIEPRTFSRLKKEAIETIAAHIYPSVANDATMDIDSHGATRAR